MQIPMLARNTSGISQLSMNSIMITNAQITAKPTYTGSSCSQRSFRSVTTADMPEIKHWVPAVSRISLMASIVTSSEVDESKKIAIMVSLSVLNA